jgi:hypothetical protein
MKLSRVFCFSLALYLAVSGAYADQLCDRTSKEYRDCVRLVDSLRPDKAGQMRVFAADGSEYNAGQVLWMKGQLRKFDRLCASGTPADAAEAAKVLAGVQELLKSHRRSS